MYYRFVNKVSYVTIMMIEIDNAGVQEKTAFIDSSKRNGIPTRAATNSTGRK